MIVNLYISWKPGGGIMSHSLSTVSSPSGIRDYVRVNLNDANFETSHSAMTNPVILSAIFSKLAFLDLKSIRLVCKLWADIGATFLATKSRLLVHQLCSKGSELQNFNPQLARNILITDDLFYENFKKTTKYLDVASPLFAVAEEIGLFGHPDNSFQTMEHVISNQLAPNLKSILTLQFAVNQQSQSTACVRDLRTLSGTIGSLIHLDFSFLVFGEDPFPFHPLYQEIVNSAINLETLKIKGNFFPNLENCSKLKSLSLFGCHIIIKQTFDPSSALTKLNDTLSQVSQSLEILAMKSCLFELDGDNSKASNLSISFGNMPNLESIEVDQVDNMGLGNNINLRQLPRLNKINLGSVKHCGLLDIFDSMTQPHDGITMLTLAADIPEDLISREYMNRLPLEIANARMYFPKVQRLELTINYDRRKEVDVALDEVKEKIEACQLWDELTKVSISIFHLEKPSQFIWVLYVLDQMNYPPSKRITFGIAGMYTDAEDTAVIKELSPEFKTGLLKCHSSIERIIIQRPLVHDCILQNLLGFIEENNLHSVQISDCETWDIFRLDPPSTLGCLARMWNSKRFQTFYTVMLILAAVVQLLRIIIWLATPTKG